MNKPPRPARLLFVQALLVLFTFVVFFAALVSYGLDLASWWAIALVGGVVTLLCVAGAGVAGRGRRGYLTAVVLGSLAHVALLVAGIWVPMAFVVALVFTALWVVALWLGAKIDRERLERLIAERPAQSDPV